MSYTIFIVGGTGAQGAPIVRNLLATTNSNNDGVQLPQWKVRVLTRDPSHHRAKELEALGAELITGGFFDYDVIRKGMEGCYGAFINTDGFALGEMAETHVGIRMFELAKQAGVRHYIWSSLDDVLQKGGMKSEYRCGHYTGKAAVANWMKSQPNEVDDPKGMMWTLLSTGPYMEMLQVQFAPIKKRADGTLVFAAPIQDGHVPIIALDDIAFWVRHIFSNPHSTTGPDNYNIEIASEMVTWPHLVETFTRVTGLPAEYKRVSMDEFFALWMNKDDPIATDPAARDSTTIEQNFRPFWSLYRDDIIKRDIEGLKKRGGGWEPITLEGWMRKNNYDGSRAMLMKTSEDQGKQKLVPNLAAIATL